MSNYSDIKRLKIKNFKNLQEVEIDFTESPIISLVGGNEHGKSSVIDALAVLGLHHKSKYQKEFIRYGTAGFGIQCELEDGTVITRIKKDKDSVNYYEVVVPGQEPWSTTKIDGGLPPQVADVMGFIQETETKEYLHFRTYREKLLFIDTPASTNYKVMYEALKVENLTRAIKEGSDRANTLKNDIDKNQSEIDTRTSQLRNIRTTDIEPAVILKNRLIENLARLEKIRKTVELVRRAAEIRKNLGALNELANAREISETRALRILNINSLLERKRDVILRKDRYSKIETAKEIDYSLILRMQKLINNINLASERRALIGSLSELSKCKEVRYDIAARMLTISQLLGRKSRLTVNEGLRDLKPLDTSVLVKLENIIEQKNKSGRLAIELYKGLEHAKELSKHIKDSGALVTNCDNCGSSVVIDPEVIGLGGVSQ